MITATKQLCMVIGDPVSHSLSPAIHNAGYKAAGVSLDFRFVTKQVTTEDIALFVSDLRHSDIRGVSCTMPHKELVLPLVDTLDSAAQAIGAVNTIVHENGTLHGYNTDHIGVVRALSRVTNLTGSRVAILGTGGAARAMAYGLTKAGAIVTIYGRSIEKSRQLAHEFSCSSALLSDNESLAQSDIICNATSVGMSPHTESSPINTSVLTAKHVVLDAVYHPLHTTLLTEAKRAGSTIVLGTEMLLYQACAQFELYTEVSAPEAAMRAGLYQGLGVNHE